MSHVPRLEPHDIPEASSFCLDCIRDRIRNQTPRALGRPLVQKGGLTVSVSLPLIDIVSALTPYPPFTRPTLESRQTYVSQMSKLAESTRVQIRNAREATLKTIRASDKKFDKNGPEAKQVIVTYTISYITNIPDSSNFMHSLAPSPDRYSYQESRRFVEKGARVIEQIVIRRILPLRHSLPLNLCMLYTHNPSYLSYYPKNEMNAQKVSKCTIRGPL